jgi:hypothetical protein
MSSISEDKDFLEIKKLAGEIKTFYDQDTRQESFNLLLTGEKGSGKTLISTTCRKPVHIDSFDSGGTKSLKHWIDKGEIMVDTRWEGDDPYNPTAFDSWRKEMEKREKMHYFNHLGTYFLDTATSWSDAIMNSVLKKAGIAGEAPRFTHDYTPQKIHIINWIKRMLRYPCDFVLTGHLESSKDEVLGKISYRFMTTGKGEVTIPLQFDELWVADTQLKSTGVEYRLITRRTGPYMATTRMGREVFELYEKPDIKYLLKKAGKNYEDKPLLT